MNCRQQIVVFTGAGISAESGLSTYRGGGLWDEYDADTVATPQGFEAETEYCLEFYNRLRSAVAAAQPNHAHLALVALEQYHDVTVITQNVDDLHERAGSSRVLHLHGELTKVTSSRNRLAPDCIQSWPLTRPITTVDRATDGSQLRPHVVMFGEYLTTMSEAIKLVKNADIFVVIGTSLSVFPANTLVNHAHHEIPRYIIDPGPLQPPPGYTHIQTTATRGIDTLLNEFKVSLKILP